MIMKHPDKNTVLVYLDSEQVKECKGKYEDMAFSLFSGMELSSVSTNYDILTSIVHSDSKSAIVEIHNISIKGTKELIDPISFIYQNAKSFPLGKANVFI